MRGVTYTRAREVLRAHYGEIERRYRKVAGAGVGSVVEQEDLTEAGDLIYGILVSLEDTSALPATPQSIEGVPLRFTVTGRHHAQPDPGC
ncbi:hypothetical protein ACIBF6_36570 [Streptosporangium amethystogenes]|uniref:hypothetical protein n=1 Tax=Streptosporangium amethystogenes TaxID=2002 RepID=UPI0037BE072C